MQEELVLLELCEEAPLDPRTERARHLRPTWTSAQQTALARLHAARAEWYGSHGDGAGSFGVAARGVEQWEQPCIGVKLSRRGAG